MWVDMLPLDSTKTDSNELKFGRLTTTGVWFLQPLQALATMQIVGVASENVRWHHKNSSKFTSKVKC